MGPGIPKFFPGQRLTTGDLNEIVSGVNSVRQPRGDETISVDQMGGGIAVRDERPPMTPDQGATLKVLHETPSGYAALGAGLYYAKVFTQCPAVTMNESASTLTMPTPAPDQAIVVFINLGEVDGEGHELDEDIYVIARQFGYTAGGWPLYASGSTSGGGKVISGKVTGNAAGNGKYTGKSFTTRTTDVPASGNLAESDFGTLAGSNDCLILNPVELGSSTTGHDVTATVNTDHFAIYFTGRWASTNSDGTKVVHAMLFYAGCE